MSLTNNYLNEYFLCPVCREKDGLYADNEIVACHFCGEKYLTNFDIPVFIRQDNFTPHHQAFLNIPVTKKSILDYIPPPKWIENKFTQEAVMFLVLSLFSLKFLFRNFRATHCEEMETAIKVGWGGTYHNILKKSFEIFHFKKMYKYIQEPSLEIGCASNNTSAAIFSDRQQKISFGLEYYTWNFLINKRNPDAGLNPYMYQVIDKYVGGKVEDIPFKSSLFNSVVMVHVIDHIVRFDEFMKELNRIIKIGGFLVFDGESASHYDNLPGVKLIRLFSHRLATKYKNWITTKTNVGGKAPIILNDEITGMGQNLFSLNEWTDKSEQYGFKLVEHAFFDEHFPLFRFLLCNGIKRSERFDKKIRSTLSYIIEHEKSHPIPEERSSKILLVLKKVKDLEID